MNKARRNAEFADMVKRGLRHRRKTPDGTVRLVFDNTEGMESDIRALAERESRCSVLLLREAHMPVDGKASWDWWPRSALRPHPAGPLDQE